MKLDDSIDKYMAKLIIKDYRQKEGLDYFDIYSLMARINSIKMVIASLRNLKVHQIGVKMAFLNGDLDEEITWNNLRGSWF